MRSGGRRTPGGIRGPGDAERRQPGIVRRAVGARGPVRLRRPGRGGRSGPAGQPGGTGRPRSGTPLLARLRVGTKLMLLVLLPVSGLMAFTVFSAVTDWREARTLRDFRTATRVSFALTSLTEALARERLAEVLVAADPDRRGVTAERDAARRATDRALTAARDGAADGTGQPDVLGQLDAKGRQLFATRVEAGSGSFTATETEQTYASLTNDLLNTVHQLDSGRPSRASGRAADGYLAALEAIEAAERERADLAVLFAAGPGNTPGVHRRPLAGTGGGPARHLPAERVGAAQGAAVGRAAPARGPYGPGHARGPRRGRHRETALPGQLVGGLHRPPHRPARDRGRRRGRAGDRRRP
ncbi:nitrate- and nitrite sensing domain-containing protein [Streptomyces sp. GLT-R25]